MARRGRPSAPTTIVEPASIFAVDALLEERITIRSLILQTSDELDAVKWLAVRGLLANSVNCEDCEVLCRFVNQEDAIDQVLWKCSACGKKKSVRHGSFFSRSKIRLSRLILLVFMWSREAPQCQVKEDCDIAEDHTVVDWFNFCRDICSLNLVHNLLKIGGLDPVTLEPKVVEIDESKFFHRKYHRGRYTEGQWVFGGVERGSNRCFMVPVEDRSAATLLPILQMFVEPGTRIVSDLWSSYGAIEQLPEGYGHWTVNHSENFVNPENAEAHTNTIEGAWSHVKRKFRVMLGSSRDLFDTHIEEFLWRRRHVKPHFPVFIAQVREYYPV